MPPVSPAFLREVPALWLPRELAANAITKITKARTMNGNRSKLSIKSLLYGNAAPIGFKLSLNEIEAPDRHSRMPLAGTQGLKAGFPLTACGNDGLVLAEWCL